MIGERLAIGISFEPEPDIAAQLQIRHMRDMVEHAVGQPWKVPGGRDLKTPVTHAPMRPVPVFWPPRGDSLIEVAENHGPAGRTALQQLLESPEPEFMLLPSPPILVATALVGLVVRNTDSDDSQSAHGGLGDPT